MSEILSLWNETPAKKAIIDYINTVTSPDSVKDFVRRPSELLYLTTMGPCGWKSPHIFNFSLPSSG